MKKLNFKRWLSGFCIAAAVFGLSSCKNGMDLDAQKAKNDIVTTASIDDMTIDLPSSKALFKLNGKNRPIFNWKDYVAINNKDNNGLVKIYCAVGKDGASAEQLSYITLTGKLEAYANGDSARIKIQYKTFKVHGDFSTEKFYIAGFMGGNVNASEDGIDEIPFEASSNLYPVNSTAAEHNLLAKIPFYFPYVQIQTKNQTMSDGVKRGLVVIPAGKFKPLGTLISFARPINAIIPLLDRNNQQILNGRILNTMTIRTNAYLQRAHFGFAQVNAAVDEPPVVQVPAYDTSTLPNSRSTLYEYSYHLMPSAAPEDSMRLAKKGRYVMNLPFSATLDDYKSRLAARNNDTVQYITWGYGYPIIDGEGAPVINKEGVTQKSNGKYFSAAFKLILPKNSTGLSEGDRITTYGDDDILVRLPEWKPSEKKNAAGMSLPDYAKVFESGKNIAVRPIVESGLVLSEVNHTKTSGHIAWNNWQYDMIELYNPNWEDANLYNYSFAKTKFPKNGGNDKVENLQRLEVFQDAVPAELISDANNIVYSFHPAVYKSLILQPSDPDFKIKKLVLGEIEGKISSNRYRNPNEFFKPKGKDEPIAAYWPVNSSKAPSPDDEYPVINSGVGLTHPHPYSQYLKPGKTMVLGAGGIYSGFTSKKTTYSQDNTQDGNNNYDGWDGQDFPNGSAAKASGVIKENLDNDKCQIFLGIDNGNEDSIPTLKANGDKNPDSQWYKSIFTGKNSSGNGIKRVMRNWGYWNANAGTLQIGEESGLILMRLDESQTNSGRRVWAPYDMFRSVRNQNDWDAPYLKPIPHGIKLKDKPDGSDKYGYSLQRNRNDVFPDKYGTPDNWILFLSNKNDLGEDNTNFFKY